MIIAAWLLGIALIAGVLFLLIGAFVIKTGRSGDEKSGGSIFILIGGGIIVIDIIGWFIWLITHALSS